MFSINISPICWILLGIELLTVLALLIFVLRPLKAVAKMTPLEESYDPSGETGTESDSVEREDDSVQTAPQSAETETPSIESETVKEENHSDDPETPGDEPEDMETPLPKVSVVVYSTVDEEILTEFLKSVCAQDYPDFEVIVVCDASMETSGMLSERYSELFRNVYVTFIPPGSHNLSRRKLALTIGIKAASGDIVITTLANVRIPSEKWISVMAAPFIGNPLIELSLGYSHPDYNEIGGVSSLYKEFYAMLTDSRWIGYALMGKPYRGDGVNLAMRRDTFFRCKGYSKTMHLHTGEDDLFVNEIADSTNTAVAITPDSILTTVWGSQAARLFSLRRSQYDFTARWLPTGPFARGGFASLCQWIVFGSGLAAALLALPNLIPAIAAFFVWLIFMIWETSFYRKAAAKLESAPLSWLVPVFWLIKPLNNMCFRSVRRSTRFKNFTWQRHKLTK
ncbi:MAG: glycosyltransferase [Muribaculaceae bacterium]|nr:glycosyltransferase [Muribaculaceae bacterium]